MVNICAHRLSQAMNFFGIRFPSRVIALGINNFIIHRIEIVLIPPDKSSVCLPVPSAHTRNMRDIILSLRFLDTVVRSDLLHVPGVLNNFSFMHHKSRSFRILCFGGIPEKKKMRLLAAFSSLAYLISFVNGFFQIIFIIFGFIVTIQRFIKNQRLCLLSHPRIMS